MRKWLMLFLILFPPLANLMPVFRQTEGWGLNLFISISLLVFNTYIWRKSLYAAWLGLPVRMTGEHWPGDKDFWRMRRRPAASYFLVALAQALQKRFELLTQTRFLSDIVQALMLAQVSITADDEFMRGRRWRKAAPQFSPFIEAYFQGFGYGPQMDMKPALEAWERTGFSERYIRYMGAVGAADATKFIAEDMPLDYAIAMRVER